jgi:predicted house-cleaning noncanonical NTP pyrophosphatase (MazG superfamily)
VTSIQEKIFFLIEKLDEELMEFSEASTQKQKREEAGDVLEVLDTLIEI